MDLKLKFAFTILSFSIVTVSTSFCYWNTGCPYKYFSTETEYDVVRGDIRDSVIKVKDCTPISIWGLVKHGQTYPSFETGKIVKEAINLKDDIRASFRQGISSLCAQDIDNIISWDFDKNILNKLNQLSEEGTKEMLYYGKRLRSAFPAIFNGTANLDVMINVTSEQWITDSAKSIVRGLNIKEEHYRIIELNGDANISTDRRQFVNSELENYFQSSDFLSAKDRIMRRLGIEGLTYEKISKIYELCRHSWSAKQKRPSPWCAAFTIEDLTVLEYIEDLKQYYQNFDRTSSNTTEKIYLLNLFNHFEEIMENDKKESEIVLNVNDGTLLYDVYKALGIFNDSEVLNGSHRNLKRKWRTSTLNSYGANFLAVLQRCNFKGSTEYNVVFYLNEQPLRSFCDGICSFKEFENIIKSA